MKTNSVILIQNSLFLKNEASDSGGAIFANEVSSLVIEKCIFYENQANFGAGIFYQATSLYNIFDYFRNIFVLNRI